MANKIKLAWCAGFFDGEGCISISKPKNQNADDKKIFTGYQLQTIIAQRDRRPLDVFVSLFGGVIHDQKANNGSTYWYYRLHNQKALAILKALVPFLVAKQKAAAMAISFQEYLNDTLPKRSHKRTDEQVETLDSFYHAMRTMNTRNKLMDYTTEDHVSLQ